MEEKEKFEDFKDFDEEEIMPELEEENDEQVNTNSSFINDIDELQKTIMNQYKDHFSQDEAEEEFQNEIQKETTDEIEEENIESPEFQEEETQSLSLDTKD